MLKASATIDTADAPGLLRLLCEHFTEHGEVRMDGGGGTIRLDFGAARLDARPSCLVVDVEARDEVFLSYMKIGLAEHVHELAPLPAPSIRWQGDGRVGGIPPFFREMRVVSSHRLTPHMQRVRLAGAALQRFAEDGFHVHLVFPPAGRVPVWPLLGADGRMVWPTGPDELHRRVYTIRHIDLAAGHVDIDIVLHAGDETAGSRFATGAAPGDIVGMTGPGGGLVPPSDNLLLLGDETALPAIARILESLPPGARAKAVVELAGPEDEIAIATKAAAEITYLHREGRAAGTCGLLQKALAETDLDALGDDLFVWAGCEFAEFKAIRSHLRRDRNIPRSRHLAVAYWRRGRSEDGAPLGAES